MRWPWRRRTDGSDAAQARAEAERALRMVQRRTRHVEEMAARVADLPADEFTERVARAFRRRPA